jgi:hypothetical protein
VSGPPGHHKTAQPVARPCGHGKGNGKGHNHGIVLAPFALGSAILTATGRIRRRTGRAIVRRRLG